MADELVPGVWSAVEGWSRALMKCCGWPMMEVGASYAWKVAWKEVDRLIGIAIS